MCSSRFLLLHSTPLPLLRSEMWRCAPEGKFSQRKHIYLYLVRNLLLLLPYSVLRNYSASLFGRCASPVFTSFFFPLLARWDSVSFVVSDYVQVYMSTAMLSKGFSSHGLEPFFSPFTANTLPLLLFTIIILASLSFFWSCLLYQ